MLKAYKYRLYPKLKHQKILSKHFGCTRFVYNWALNKKIQTYQKESKHVSCFALNYAFKIYSNWNNSISHNGSQRLNCR